MKAVEFPGMTGTFGAHQPEYEMLPVHRSLDEEHVLTSCWEPEPHELEELKAVLAQGGKVRVWLQVLSYGNPPAPVSLKLQQEAPFQPRRES